MPLTNRPRELTTSFRNRNILAHHFLATIKIQGQSNSERSFITYIMNSTVFTQKISLIALVWGREDLRRAGRPALLVKKEFLLVPRQEEGQERVGAVNWVCVLPLTELVINRRSLAPLCLPQLTPGVSMGCWQRVTRGGLSFVPQMDAEQNSRCVFKIGHGRSTKRWSLKLSELEEFERNLGYNSLQYWGSIQI